MRIKLARAVALMLAVVSPLANAYAQRPTRSTLQRTVDSLVASALRGGPVAGMSVAVVRGRDTIVLKGYGLADVENDVTATAQTVYRIGSITKQFTSAAVMQLIEQNKLRSMTDRKILTNITTAWRGARFASDDQTRTTE